MNRSNDAWPVTVLFAVLLLCLAKVMAAEKPETNVERRLEPKRAATFEAPPATPVSSRAAATPFGYAPEFTLKDPLGKDYSSEALFKDTGMLVMITVPTLTQYERQKRWEKLVSRHHWPEHGAPQRVLIEDMSQQTMYKEKARGMMRACYKPGGDTVVLIDESGDVRRAFNMMNDETMVLLCDAKGRILHIEPDEVEPDETVARRLMTEVTRLADATAKATVASTPKVATATAPVAASSTLLLTSAPVRK